MESFKSTDSDLRTQDPRYRRFYTDFGHMVTRLKNAVAAASLQVYHMLLVVGYKYEKRLPKENMILSEYRSKSEYRKKARIEDI